MENLGFKVTIKLNYPYDPNIVVVLRNVTEIHYGYPTVPREIKVAFESDIHGTGMTYSMASILEFEAVLETERAEAF